MANIATDVKWGTEPTLLFNFSYGSQRVGTTQYYKIKTECEPLPVAGVHYFGYPIYIEITVNGKIAATKTLKNITPYRWDDVLTYTTGWISVENKTTGATPIVIRIYSGEGSTRDTKYSYSLPIDPAPSMVAATDANIESVSTVTFTRYNSGFTHTLSYMAEGQTSYTTIFSKQSVTSYAWTVPKALYDLIPKAKTVGVTLQCQTYNGSALVGTTTCEMTATAEYNRCAPNLTVTAYDANENTVALTGSNKRIIRYHSDVQATATATAKNGASISKTTLYCGDKTATSGAYTFKDAESNVVEATAIDSRGYTRAVSAGALTLVKYIKLTTNAEVKRTDPTADTVLVTAKGNYYNGSFGAVNNTLRLQVRYKPKTKPEFEETDGWTEMAVTISGNTYTAEATLSGLDYKLDYDIRVRASDAIYKHSGPLANAVYHNLPLFKYIPVFDWGENDFRFNVPVKLIGDLYHADGAAGLDANNSDIVGVNGLYFADEVSNIGEGIKFYRDGDNWDRVWASGGNLYFCPNEPSNTTLYKLFYAPGDTETQIENTIYSGIITGSTQYIFFFIPLSKPVIATSATLSGKVIARGVGGYVHGTNADTSGLSLTGGTGYSVTATLQNNGVWVRIKFDAKIANATNNTNVSVGPVDNVTITFA